MANLDYDKKLNSKPFRFFDLVFRIIITNVFTIILSLTVIGFLPSIVAAYASLKKERSEMYIKTYFKNFLHYFKRAFLVEIWLFILFGVNIYSIYFYYNSSSDITFTNFFINIGFTAGLLIFLILLFLSVHFPLLIITFEKFSTWEIYKTSLYITFKYVLTSLILFVLTACCIGAFILCFVFIQLLAVWMLFGISLPIYLGIKVTTPIYYKLEHIDFEKIIQQVDEEESDE